MNGTSILVLAVFAIAITVGLFGGVAVAGDNVALIYFEPQEATVDSGETVVVEATLRTHGGYGGEGVKSVNKTIAYDPEVLTVAEVTRGPWLDSDGETDVLVETAVDDEEGRVTVEQIRHPASGGITGDGTTVVLTFEVDDDAQPADVLLQYADADVVLVNGVPQHVMERDGVVRIDGGGEERAPLVDDEGDTPGITTPEETPTPTSTATATPTPASDDDSDEQPGFGLVPILGALLGLSLLWGRHTKFGRIYNSSQ